MINLIELIYRGGSMPAPVKEDQNVKKIHYQRQRMAV